MNYKIVFRLLSVIMAALTASFAVSLGVAVAHADGNLLQSRATLGFGGSMIAAGTLALLFYGIGRKCTPRIFSREALTVVGLGWILASLVGAIPYIIILPEAGVANAIFESSSGLTTTGASVLSNLEDLPRSLLLWRAMSQWIGGLGVVVFFVSILAFLGAGAKILYSRESSAQAADLGSERVQTGVLRIVYLYLGLSAACAASFWMAGMNFFDAITHMMATISTGGFGNYSAGFGHFASPLLDWLCILFMLLGGTSFLVLIRLLRREKKVFEESTETKAYLLVILVATLISVVFRLETITSFIDLRQLEALLRSSAFHVVSILTTTGYATEDFDLWPPVLHVLLLLLMTMGGCSGSTSGGLKIARFVVALKVTQQQIENSFRSHVVRTIRMSGHTLSIQAREEVITFLLIAGMVLNVGTLVVALFEPSMSFEGTISATFACLFNIGPGFAEVGPMQNFASLHSWTKCFLSLLMILGRVELFAILVLFSPSLWKRF